MLRGDQTQIGADGGAAEAVPVTNLHREAERGQHGDPAQTRQRAHARGKRFGVCHRGDLCIQTVSAVQRQLGRLQAGLVGGLQGSVVEVLLVQPGVAGFGPGMAAGIYQSVTQ